MDCFANDVSTVITFICRIGSELVVLVANVFPHAVPHDSQRGLKISRRSYVSHCQKSDGVSPVQTPYEM
jgi:hypothetical protein